MNRTRHHAGRGAKGVSYLGFVASTLALVAIVLWFFWPHVRPEPAASVTIVQAPASAGATPGSSAAAPRSYRKAVESAGPSVVNVYTAKRIPRDPRRYENPLLRYFYGGQPSEEPSTALGSGVIVSDQGFVLTNNHVVEGADEIAVALADGRLAAARVVGTDPETDLAVLRVKADGLRPIAFASPGQLGVGDVVLAIGNPFGVGQTVTQGIVSATGRSRLGINTFENFIQTDAAINPGNSGGALVDVDGNFVGINTAIFSQSGGSQGIGFAIPTDLAAQVLKQIIEQGRVVRGWLGIEARDVAPADAIKAEGALVAAVQPNGPAARAGLRRGDLIVAINGKPVADAGALVTEAAALAPGARSEVRVLRDGKETAIAVEVGRRPPIRRAQ